MTVRIDALDSSTLVPQQPILWQQLDINTLNFNAVGAFTLVMPATDRNWQLITFDTQGEFQPVALYVDWNGVFQVPLLAEQWEHDLTVDPNTGILTETITLSGADFLALLANRVVFPDGTQPWASQTPTPVTVTGAAETVIKTLVSANMVTAGDAARNVPNFAVATDQGRGGTVTYTITPPLPTGLSNLFEGNEITFEASTGNWVAITNCSIAQTTARAHGGTHSLAVTASAAGDVNLVSCPGASILTEGKPVRPGDSVTVSGWFRAASAARTCLAGIDWYDSTGTYLSTDFGNGASDKTGGWMQTSGTAAAPDSAVLARMSVKVQGCASGEVHYFDDASFADNGSNNPSGANSTANLGDSLMDMVRDVAAQSQIGVQISLTGGQLVFDCYIPRDLSKAAVFSAALGNLRGDTISDAAPTADVILLEDGHAVPDFTEQDASGPAPADPWRRAEMFDDQTSTTAASDISSAATADLQQGASVHQLVITATDIPMLRFGKTVSPVQGYELGDTVTVSIRPGVAYTDIVSAVELTAGSDTGGTAWTGPVTGVQTTAGFGTYYELVTPTIGTPSASATDQSAVRRLAAQVRRIDKAVQRARKSGQ